MRTDRRRTARPLALRAAGACDRAGSVHDTTRTSSGSAPRSVVAHRQSTTYRRAVAAGDDDVPVPCATGRSRLLRGAGQHGRRRPRPRARRVPQATLTWFPRSGDDDVRPSLRAWRARTRRRPPRRVSAGGRSAGARAGQPLRQRAVARPSAAGRSTENRCAKGEAAAPAPAGRTARRARRERGRGDASAGTAAPTARRRRRRRAAARTSASLQCRELGHRVSSSSICRNVASPRLTRWRIDALRAPQARGDLAVVLVVEHPRPDGLGLVGREPREQTTRASAVDPARSAPATPRRARSAPSRAAGGHGPPRATCRRLPASTLRAMPTSQAEAGAPPPRNRRAASSAAANVSAARSAASSGSPHPAHEEAEHEPFVALVERPERRRIARAAASSSSSVHPPRLLVAWPSL